MAAHAMIISIHLNALVPLDFQECVVKQILMTANLNLAKMAEHVMMLLPAIHANVLLDTQVIFFLTFLSST
jgi:hypothetical protein